MSELARVEGSEVVVRIPISLLSGAAKHNGLVVTNAKELAAHFARELNAEGMDEDLFLNKVLDAALVRCAEGDAPGLAFAEGLNF